MAHCHCDIYGGIMEYRLIATDMDGTLLDENSTITPATCEAVKKAMDKGVKFILCTGRPVRGVKEYVDQLGLDCPVITYNGAVVVHSTTGEIIFSQNMDTAEARKVYETALAKGTWFIVWSQNRLYTNRFGPETDFYQNITSSQASLIEDFDSLLARGITKMLWGAEPETLDCWIEELKTAGFCETTFTKSRRYYLEFFSNRTSKAVAMEKLGEYYGIKREEMVALGDQTNDLPMLEYAGLGIAMGNAVEAVKAVADCITAPNTEDGVAKAIEKFIL